VSSAGRFDDLEVETPFPGVSRRALDTAGATITEYTFEPGATFPQHHHPQEQITLILEGEVELTAAAAPETLGPGGWSVVEGGVAHGITAGPAGTRFLAVLVPRRDPGAYTLSETPDEPKEPSA
jgi:quercetin dioxygenase-like cupin family protein